MLERDHLENRVNIISSEVVLLKDVNPEELARQTRGIYEETPEGVSKGKIKFDWSPVVIHFDLQHSHLVGSKNLSELDCCIEDPTWSDADGEKIRPSIKYAAVFTHKEDTFIVLPRKTNFPKYFGIAIISPEIKTIQYITAPCQIDKNVVVVDATRVKLLKAERIARMQKSYFPKFYEYQQEKITPRVKRALVDQ